MSNPDREAAVEEDGSQVETLDEPTPARGWRRWWWVPVAVVAAIALMVVGGYLALNQNHDGVLPIKAQAEPPEAYWTHEGLGEGVHPEIVTVDANRALLGGLGGEGPLPLIMLDTRSGQEIWRLDIPGGSGYARFGPIEGSSRVWLWTTTIDAGARLFVIDAGSGEVVSESPELTDVWSVVAADDKLYTIAETEVAQYDPVNLAEPQWRSQVPPVMATEGVLVADVREGWLTISLSPDGSRAFPRPAAFLLALDVETGIVAPWVREYASYWLDDDSIYRFDGLKLESLHPNGQVSWAREVSGSPEIRDGMVLLNNVEEDGTHIIERLDPITGDTMWRSRPLPSVALVLPREEQIELFSYQSPLVITLSAETGEAAALQDGDGAGPRYFITDGGYYIAYFPEGTSVDNGGIPIEPGRVHLASVEWDNSQVRWETTFIGNLTIQPAGEHLLLVDQDSGLIHGLI